MIKLILTIAFMFISSSALAADYWVIIERVSHPDTSNTQIGDVIEIRPATVQYEPTKSELDNFLFLIVNIPDAKVDEVFNILMNYDDINNLARKFKINIDGNTFSQKERITKNTLDQIVVQK